MRLEKRDAGQRPVIWLTRKEHDVLTEALLLVSHIATCCANDDIDHREFISTLGNVRAGLDFGILELARVELDKAELKRRRKAG